MNSSSSSPRRSRPGSRLKRILLWGFAGLVILYLGGATAGYLFLRHVRKNDQVTVIDVALLRWREVRRSMAAQQFAKAKSDWEAGNFQAAFVAFTFAVANDPDHVPGRLDAARFLREAGAVPLALTMLEAGLVRAPAHEDLTRQTYELLLATGRDARALELLRQAPLASLSPATRLRLRMHELQARLNLGQIDAAREFVAAHPDLATASAARPIVARLLWETKERLRAIDLLAAHVSAGEASLTDHAQLCEWQLAAGRTTEAVEAATAAIRSFPAEPPARLLLLEALAAHSHRGREWQSALEAYIRDFGGRPEALRQLAGLAGRRGWINLTRRLYENAALRDIDLSGFALSYCDALIRSARFRDATETLAQIEAQALEAAMPFMVQLRTRQVFVAAGMGDLNAVSDIARRLAGLVRNDAGARELLRRSFVKAGIRPAADELADRGEGRVAATGPASGS